MFRFQMKTEEGIKRNTKYQVRTETKKYLSHFDATVHVLYLLCIFNQDPGPEAVIFFFEEKKGVWGCVD